MEVFRTISGAVALAAAVVAIVAPAAFAAKSSKLPIDGGGRGEGKLVRVHKAAQPANAYRRATIAQLH